MEPKIYEILYFDNSEVTIYEARLISHLWEDLGDFERLRFYFDQELSYETVLFDI